MTKIKLFQILIVLGFLCAGKINAQPIIVTLPPSISNQTGYHVISATAIKNALDAATYDLPKTTPIHIVVKLTYNPLTGQYTPAWYEISSVAFQNGCAGYNVVEITLEGNPELMCNRAFGHHSSNSGILGLQKLNIHSIKIPMLLTNCGTGTYPSRDWFEGIPFNCTLCVRNDMRDAFIAEAEWRNAFNNGRIQACLTSIEEYIPNNTVNIYPNPTVSEFTVSFELEKSCNMKILLCDVLGSELLEIYDGFATVGTFTKTVKTEHLAKGVYYLKILIDGNSTVEKIIVE